MVNFEEGEVKIEKNVPIPPRKGRHGEWVRWDAIKIGDSFVMPNQKRAKHKQSNARAKGIRLIYRKQNDGTYRLWRIQ